MTSSPNLCASHVISGSRRKAVPYSLLFFTTPSMRPKGALSLPLSLSRSLSLAISLSLPSCSRSISVFISSPSCSPLYLFPLSLISGGGDTLTVYSECQQHTKSIEGEVCVLPWIKGTQNSCFSVLGLFDF